MKLYINSKINNYIKDERSKRQFKNIIYSFIFKGGSIMCSFLLVPLTLKFLNIVSYGIWLTITSIVSWVNVLDGGLGNGLKNKLSESIAVNDRSQSRVYITSAYVGIAAIVSIIIVLFLGSLFFVNWAAIFKAPPSISQDVLFTTIIVFLGFSLRLVLDIINTILIANQKVGIVSIINFVANFIILIGVYIITKVIVLHKLVYLSAFLCISPIFILIIFSVYFFLKDYKDIKPSYVFFNFKALKDLLSLGIKFFVIQIAVIIIFSTDNLIITRLFSPADVTVYNIAFKLFSVFTFAWLLLLTPYWVAFNEAYVKNDFQWIRKTVYSLERVWGLFSITVIIVFFISDKIYRLWVGEAIIIPYKLSFFMALFVLISTLTNLYIYFINGIGKIKLQFWISIFGALINLPLCIFLGSNLKLGIVGIIISTCISLIPSLIFSRVQYLKIINNKTNTSSGLSGIWFE